MKGSNLLCLAVGIAAAVPADAAIRAVFVGIDRYAYSQTVVPNADFKDLKGAVNDVRRIKETLRAAYGLDLDTEQARECRSSNAVSTTLLDSCATRTAILDAWRRQIAQSAAGDTLILYYAGHGSQFVDSQIFDQSSGYNDTILPHDARKPNAEVEVDIVDREIKVVIDEAIAEGVNVVSIFDSCNSGTATRDGPVEGESRAAPPRKPRGLAPVRAAAPPGAGRGYRVHFAASADGEEARETGAIGVRSGVFTTALSEAIRVMPNAAFADIATEVRLKVGERGHTAQHPQAEGALTARLGGDERRVPLLDAAVTDGQIRLAGGELTGVTAGSSYSLFARTTDALDDSATPLARGVVKTVGPAQADLTIEGGSVAGLPQRLIARETAHAFGGQALTIRNGAPPADSERIADLLREMSFVKLAGDAPVAIVASKGEYKLVGVDGFAIAALGTIVAEDFPARLRLALQRVARVRALLALRTDASRADVNFCIGQDLDANAFACRPAVQSDGPRLKAGARAKLIAVNRAAEPRYLYVFVIDQDYAVNLALPDDGGLDSAVAPGRPVVAFGAPDAKGRVAFLILSTDQPIKASVLEQRGAGARDPSGCTTALARALCAAQQGTRDPEVPRVGNWTATVTSAVIE